jgi:hypothetical protein
MGEKTTEYVFGELTNQRDFNYYVSKVATRTSKALTSQTKFNKAVVLLSWMGIAYLYFNQKKISKLTKEVEELKQMKGE